MLDLLSQPINFFSDLKDDPSIFIGEVWLRLVCLSFDSAGRFLSLFFFDLVRLKPWMVNPLRPGFLLLVVACGGSFVFAASSLVVHLDAASASSWTMVKSARVGSSCFFVKG